MFQGDKQKQTERRLYHVLQVLRPLTSEQTANVARAHHIYNSVANYCGEAAPTFKHYMSYCVHKTKRFDEELAMVCMFGEAFDWDDEEIKSCMLDEHKRRWAAIKRIVDHTGYVSDVKHYVYFAIFNDGAVKCGQTNRLALRHSQLSTEHGGIDRMWYLELSDKTERKAAEHALHCFFDRCRLIDRIQGKQDWYQGEHDAVVEYIRWNKKKMYDAVMATVVG